ncbi:hypothetical protein [Loktanella sp. S4079]|uniref:hypothetical protein n=1 Tax=Loktanella sp. S4079 TaxID=579483 RepID=UPI0005F9E4D9|nr:hypothetical protein [Loktanella sp. S4079]KJZ18701.1 hypothetical protein TW80_13045 [Loktanella sp. S4079]
MNEDESIWARETLGYTDQWIELGILTDEICQVQRQQWSKIDADRNTEHYRFSAWRAFGGAKGTISNEDLQQCIMIAASDADPAMGRAILHDILKTSWLSDEQFQRVRREMNEPSEAKIVDRYTLFRTLRADPSHENLDRAVRVGDSIVQRHVIDKYPLKRTTLEFLEQYGEVRAIKNLARQELGSGKLKE